MQIRSTALLHAYYPFQKAWTLRYWSQQVALLNKTSEAGKYLENSTILSNAYLVTLVQHRQCTKNQRCLFTIGMQYAATRWLAQLCFLLEDSTNSL